MATENLDGIYGLPAAADLSASQYCFGVVNTSGQVALCGANARVVDGQIHNQPLAAVGSLVRLMSRNGVVLKAKIGATVTNGALLTTDASGRLVVATSGQFVCAKALEAGVVGDIRQVLFYGANGMTAP